MTDRLALLRGINVGGKNLVKMEALREAFADLGAEDAQTFIASGNVLYRGGLTAAGLEPTLTERFGIELKVVGLTAEQLQAVVTAAPDGFGGPQDNCDVIFLRPPLTVATAFALFDPREGIDRVWPGEGVVYHARLRARASGSRLSNIVAAPEYKEMTLRSWSTVSKLAVLMASRTEADRERT